jgi:ABC-2 type transport system ATP-binding protein
MDAIQVQGLTKRYGGHVAVDGISFSVHQGEAFGILGPNGAGKTTTLEMIEGLRKPDAGDIEVLGMPVWPDPMPVQARIGVQLQSTALFDRLSARELLELFARFYASDDPAGRARRALGLVGLESKQDDYAARMSGGQQQRLAIALALVHDPDVVFLDEPTTGLDPQARRNLWEVIRTIHGEAGKTVVLTTHYLEEAELLCERVAIMDEARIVALDTPAGLIASLNADVRVAYTDQQGEHVLYAQDAQAAVLEVLETARTAGRPVEGLSVKGPSLEDVFLNLTGREFRE